MLNRAWRSRDLLSSIVFFVAFFFLYRGLGLAVIGAMSKFDYFGGDADEWLDMKRDAEPRHPLTPLIMEPVAMVVRLLVAQGPGQAAVLNATLGAAAVVLTYHAGQRLLTSWWAGCLVAMAFGLGMSELIAGSVPESYAISACSIATTYLLCLHSLNRNRASVPAWSAAAVFSLGATVSTLPQTAVTFVAALWADAGERKLRRAIATVVLTVAAAAVLIAVQTTWLHTKIPFSAATLEEEAVDINDHVFVSVESPDDRPAGERPELRVVNLPRELLFNLFLLDFVGAEVGRTPEIGDGDRTKLEYFGYPLKYSFVGLAAAVMWLALWGAGVVANVRDLRANSSNKFRAFFVALLIIVAGNTIMLAVYNPPEMFLYTPLTVLPILLAGVSPTLLAERRWQAAWTVLVVLMAVNNVSVMLEMVR